MSVGKGEVSWEQGRNDEAGSLVVVGEEGAKAGREEGQGGACLYCCYSASGLSL